MSSARELDGQKNKSPAKFGVIFLIPIEILVKYNLYTCTLTDNHGKEKIVRFYPARCTFMVAAHDFHVHLVYVNLPCGEIDHILHSYMC